MRHCSNCLENNWRFEKADENWIRATCKMCGFEVEWEKKKQTLKEGEKCVKCSGTIHYHESKFKESKLLKPFYYTGYYRCEKCRAFFHSDEFKVVTGVEASLPNGYVYSNNGEIFPIIK